MDHPMRPKASSVDPWRDVELLESGPTLGGQKSAKWKVRMQNGVTKDMTVDELDDAFEKHEIGLTTLVQRPSGGEWRTLGEAAGVDDSIRPVSSDQLLPEIPKPPPLPRTSVTPEQPALTEDELSVLPPKRRTGRKIAIIAALGLAAGGILASRHLPAKPVASMATSAIMAPPAEAPAAPATPVEALPAAPSTPAAPAITAAPPPKPAAPVVAAKPAPVAAKPPPVGVKHAPVMQTKKATWKAPTPHHAADKKKLLKKHA